LKNVFSSPDAPELQQIYATRFAGRTDYRTQVWRVLTSYFGRWCPSNGVVLDLGAGYCEFINNVDAPVKYAMDLNPDVHKRATEGVTVIQQDVAEPWPLPCAELDAVFTSNFLEHLPNKAAVRVVLSNAYRCLKPGGCLIAMGPNIKYLPGAYWDFFDHYVQLTELSLAEALSNCGFEIETQVARFLPYTMSHGRQYPVWMLRLYLTIPAIWPIFGKQFLVVSRKPSQFRRGTSNVSEDRER
jgi:SAM-dependent methyltransferase